ncbi:MAG: hydroxyacid dehydrogenase [Halobacteriovoraceae bacterium]|nr:hydroxyacid dehydrogenase [Halobacteriovoraceae bacterium]
MKPFIVVCDGMDKQVFQTLTSAGEFDVHPEPKNSQDTIKELLPKASALIIRSATTITADTLEAAPNLKLVIRAGEGTDNIDKKACEAKGVKVANTPGANNNSAAEHAIALMMTVLRKTAAADKTMKSGGWDKNKYTGVELANKKVGIVGFGRIGQIVAKRIQGFEPEVLFFDPFIEKSELPYAKKAADLKEIFSSCDVISLHTPLMEKTKGLVNAELLNAMPSHSIIVNASRGGIVDEEALLDVLKKGNIRGAGFDVFATEPLEENSPLRELENIVLTPHLGASTEEAQLRVGEMAVNQIKEFFLNNNLLNEVKA